MKGAQTRSAPGKEWLADEHNGPSGPNQDPVFPKSLLNPSQGAKDGTFKALRMVMEKVRRTSLARGNNYYSVKAGVFPEMPIEFQPMTSPLLTLALHHHTTAASLKSLP